MRDEEIRDDEGKKKMWMTVNATRVKMTKVGYEVRDENEGKER